jgi:hypothetical protein
MGIGPHRSWLNKARGHGGHELSGHVLEFEYVIEEWWRAYILTKLAIFFG